MPVLISEAQRLYIFSKASSASDDHFAVGTSVASVLHGCYATGNAAAQQAPGTDLTYQLNCDGVMMWYDCPVAL